MIEILQLMLRAFEDLMKLLGFVRASKLPQPRIDLHIEHVGPDRLLLQALVVVENTAAERIEVRRLGVPKRRADLGRDVRVDVNARPRIDYANARSSIVLTPRQASIAPGQKWQWHLYIRLKRPAAGVTIEVAFAVMAPREITRTVHVTRALPAG